MKSSGLTEDQIKDSFNNFLRDHPNGKLKHKHFRDIMTQAVPKKDAKKLEKHVFRMYDNNRDGSIDFTEFMMVFHILSEGSPEEVLTKIFRIFDVNGDGDISVKEMNKVINDMYGLLKAEDSNIATKQRLAKAAFEEMDTNSDGKVNEEEFVKACLGQEEISRMITLKIIDMFVDDQ